MVKEGMHMRFIVCRMVQRERYMCPCLTDFTYIYTHTCHVSTCLQLDGVVRLDLPVLVPRLVDAAEVGRQLQADRHTPEVQRCKVSPEAGEAMGGKVFQVWKEGSD